MFVDARGKDCPQPVMLVKKAIEKGASQLTVMVDSDIPAQNVCRLLTKLGFCFSEKKESSHITIQGYRSSEADRTKNLPTPIKDNTDSGKKAEDASSYVLLICKKTLGEADSALGEVLIKGFLSTMAEKATLPKTIILMNEGVFLAEKGSSTQESLEKMVSQGTELLVCGTCTNHFGITPDITTGIISNMFDITEAMVSASRLFTLP